MRIELQAAPVLAARLRSLACSPFPESLQPLVLILTPTSSSAVKLSQPPLMRTLAMAFRIIPDGPGLPVSPSQDPEFTHIYQVPFCRVRYIFRFKSAGPDYVETILLSATGLCWQCNCGSCGATLQFLAWATPGCLLQPAESGKQGLV